MILWCQPYNPLWTSRTNPTKCKPGKFGDCGSSLDLTLFFTGAGAGHPRRACFGDPGPYQVLGLSSAAASKASSARVE